MMITVKKISLSLEEKTSHLKELLNIIDENDNKKFFIEKKKIDKLDEINNKKIDTIEKIKELSNILNETTTKNQTGGSEKEEVPRVPEETDEDLKYLNDFVEKKYFI